MQEKLRLPRFETREVNELVEARLKLKARGLNLSAEAPLRLGQVLLVEHDLREAEYRGERRAKLVRHAFEEERAVAAHSLQLKVRALKLRRAAAQLFDERFDAAALLVHRGGATRVAERDDDRLPDATHARERPVQTTRLLGGYDHHARQRAAHVYRHAHRRLHPRARVRLAQPQRPALARALVETKLPARALD